MCELLYSLVIKLSFCGYWNFNSSGIDC